ncbi:hypothetical protein EW145_g7712 [Phellinidium pouzarii]|uniref:Uncharacterized protein n=1 Tax=Phellinidium pouzarii TaxID=167371 RepID=A0A4V3XA55_9AGAM|nr:hypothetical protein EW145_g7712 [Phellinidium pouzarii]
MASTGTIRLETAPSAHLGPIKIERSNFSDSIPKISRGSSGDSPANSFSPPNALFSARSDHFPQNALDDSCSNEISEQNSTPPDTKHDQSEMSLLVDVEPVPFSSTPDLGSRASSSSSSESVSQSVRTPSEDNFINILDRKLEAIVKKERECEDRLKIRWSGHVHSGEMNSKRNSRFNSYSLESVTHSEKYALTPGGAGWSPAPIPSERAHRAPKRGRTDDSNCDPKAQIETNSNAEGKKTDTHLDIPVSKKLKETSFSYTVTETASSRRAHTLSACASFTSSSPLVPTEPASPTGSNTSDGKSTHVLIIAPPTFAAIPRPPLTPDDAAEARLGILMEKEMERRRLDGFEKGFNPFFDKFITQENVNTFLGIDEHFRMKVIQWMLRVTPSKKLRVAGLRDQLRSSPETRFHAILLFSRYFMRVGDAMPVATEKETPLMTLGRQRITWDVAVSCLALAVKFHRDFLGPLSPIYSREFLVIAPHPMSHDDFEISQKDVLQALDYQIHEPTPEPFLTEIWNSLPTLRRLLSFTEGWEVAQMNAWHRLNVAIVAGEMFQFPMSILASAALIEGGIEALIALYESDMETRVGRELNESEEVNLEDKAMLAFSGVVEDIKDLMNITSVNAL